MSTAESSLPDHISHMLDAVMATLPDDPFIPVRERITEQKAAVSAMVAYDPQDALESLLVAQSVAYAHLALRTLRHAVHGETPDTMMRLARSASQFTNLSERLSLRLERHRAAGSKTPFQQRTARERVMAHDPRASGWAAVEAAHDALLAEDMAAAMIGGHAMQPPAAPPDATPPQTAAPQPAPPPATAPTTPPNAAPQARQQTEAPAPAAVSAGPSAPLDMEAVLDAAAAGPQTPGPFGMTSPILRDYLTGALAAIPGMIPAPDQQPTSEAPLGSGPKPPGRG